MLWHPVPAGGGEASRAHSVWGTLDGCDVSVPQTHSTLTDASTAQLQVLSPPSGSVRPSLSFPVTSLPSTPKLQPAPLRTASSTLLNMPAIAPLQQTAPIPPPVYPHFQCFLAKRATSPHGSGTVTHTRTFSNPIVYAFWSHTNTSTPTDVDRSCLPTLNPPLSISKPNYNIVIASSSVSIVYPVCPTLRITSLTFHPSTTDATACCADERQHYGAL